ncbi:hypothetical protein JTB14_005299 [Gonioctena quinquepunctata]|nr:hypothetical protein JTB14_005299 [Gonioctena quinquepunctata]
MDKFVVGLQENAPEPEINSSTSTANSPGPENQLNDSIATDTEKIGNDIVEVESTHDGTDNGSDDTGSKENARPRKRRKYGLKSQTDSDFAPSHVTDRPDPTQEPDVVNVTENLSLNLENPELLHSAPELDISTTEIIRQIETANEPTPSCSSLQKTFSSSKIRPLLKAPPRKTNTNSRRKRKSTVLIDTPEKEASQKEYEEKMKKNRKKMTKLKGKERGSGKAKDVSLVCTDECKQNGVFD